MKWLSFILYLFKNGSLGGKPLNFEQHRREIIGSASPDENYQSKNFYHKLRNTLIQIPYVSTLIGNLAYIKNFKKIHRQYFFIDRYKICYVRILKSASTSILKELLPHIDQRLHTEELSDKQIDLLADKYFNPNTSKKNINYQYFTVVRNPFHRIVSVYLDLYDPDNNFFSYQSYLFGIIKREMNFKEFVSVITQIPDSIKSSHFASQHYILMASCGLEKIKCFRLEYDQDSLNTFLAGMAMKIPHSNKQNLRYDYRAFYDKNTLSIVYNLYKADVECFDYKNEYNALLSYVSTG
ncbi:MAG TPA: sulfotransferase family 2 domain-containing protein [Cyclobacteriaceae bacterium]